MGQAEIEPESDQPQEPIDRLLRPFQIFGKNKVAGAILLMACTAIAIIWANSPWADSYTRILSTRAIVGLGSFTINKPLLHWINDGLMAVFFFLVGLEIKREILVGQLSSLRKASLPIFAAIGGMVVPALFYAAINREAPGARGWGIPMATDIAFALGVLLFFEARVPAALKVFLAALAIVDDIGAIVVIAIFYTDTIAVGSLIAGGVLIGLSVLANLAGVRSATAFFVIGTLVWVAFLKSGIHATLAAVLMAMTIPARTRIAARPLVERVSALLEVVRARGGEGTRLLDADQQHALDHIEDAARDAGAPLLTLEHALVPLVTFVVMPVFALANAGVALGGGVAAAAASSVSLGIVAGLFLGKQAGVFGVSYLAVRLGWAELPTGVGWRAVHAAAVLAGIGFTMSLFIAGLAFEDPGVHQSAKLGTLIASVISAAVGSILLSRLPARNDDVSSGGVTGAT